MSNKKFNFEELPIAYLSNNKKGDELRNQLIKNELKLSSCNIGDLEKTFFSKENIDNINKALILNVYNKTNKKFLICNQSEEKLIIVMRYIFIEYSRNLLFDISGQIKKLNNIVINELTPQIISNAEQQIDYIRDITTQPLGPPLPISTNFKSKNTLPTYNFH